MRMLSIYLLRFCCRIDDVWLPNFTGLCTAIAYIGFWREENTGKGRAGLEKWQSLQGNLKWHRHQLPQDHPRTRVHRQHQVQDRGLGRLHLLEVRPPGVGVLLLRQGNWYEFNLAQARMFCNFFWTGWINVLWVSVCSGGGTSRFVSDVDYFRARSGSSGVHLGFIFVLFLDLNISPFSCLSGLR